MNFIQVGSKGKNEWWMYVVTIIIVFIGTQLGTLPLGMAALLHVDGDLTKFQESANSAFMDIGMNSSFYLFLMLLSFVVGLLALIICVKALHKKKLKWVITSRDKVDWKRFFYGFFLWSIISIVLIGATILLIPENFVWNFKLGPFLTLLLVSVLFIPLQTSMEELLFRGYLMQAFGLLVKNRWFPLFITSIMFGLLHGANPEVAKIGYIALVFYIGTGFLFGITTLMDEGTELALGMHAVNNIIAALFVTTDWTVFQTDAMYIDVSEPSVGWEMFFPVLVVYPLVLFILSKKYGWTNWKEKLFGKIEKTIEVEELGVS